MEKFEKFELKMQHVFFGGGHTSTTWSNSDGSQTGCDLLLEDGRIAYMACC